MLEVNCQNTCIFFFLYPSEDGREFIAFVFLLCSIPSKVDKEWEQLDENIWLHISDYWNRRMTMHDKRVSSKIARIGKRTDARVGAKVGV